MTDEELQQQIKQAVDEATTALAAKNKELLTELKEARKGKQIDPAELDKLQARIDGLEVELTTANKLSKDQAKLLEQSKASLEVETGFTSKLLLDNGLTDALVKANVAAPFLPAVKAMLLGQAKIVTDGDNRKAVIGDKDLSTFIGEWSASDEGKHYIQAPANSGGGSTGGANGSGSKTVSRSSFDSMSQGDRANFVRNGGKVTE